MARQALEYISLIWGLDTNRIEQDEPHASVIDNLVKFDNELHRSLYGSFKNQLDIIFSYIQNTAAMDLDKDDREKLNKLLYGFIGLSNACKATENIRENISTLRDALDPHVRTIYYELMDIIIRMNKAVYSSI